MLGLVVVRLMLLVLQTLNFVIQIVMMMKSPRVLLAWNAVAVLLTLLHPLHRHLRCHLLHPLRRHLVYSILKILHTRLGLVGVRIMLLV